MNGLTNAILFLAFGGSSILYAQLNLGIGSRQVQVHGFLSEGFAQSSDNNFLRMNTSGGSFFTEAGISVSSQITEKLYVGVQAYDRYIGKLGMGKVYLDWALADYRWKDWIAFRAGKVKTPLGLYNDTQDQEFLHTWALLPQSIYPADLRAMSIAHIGGDVYGNISIKRAGSIAYVVFAGTLQDDPRGGYLYGVQAQGVKIARILTGKQFGFDLRWRTPLRGLSVGTSVAANRRGFQGTLGPSPPLTFETKRDRVVAYFGEFTRGNFRANAEYRSQSRRAEATALASVPIVLRPGSEERAWFASAAQRLSSRIEAGTYYSHYRVKLLNPVVPVTGPGRDHIFDKVVTIRFDLSTFWDFKIEGHFMDGVGSPALAHGFYPQDNRSGLKQRTNILIVRTGWYF